MISEHLKTMNSIVKDKISERFVLSVQGIIETEDYEEEDSDKRRCSGQEKKSRGSGESDITDNEEHTIFRNYFIH